MTRRHCYQSPSRQRCDALRILIAVSACFLLGVVVKAMPDYMYAGQTRAVKEYVPRRKDPRLLFMNIKAPRVVEFYSPTCPACRAFRKSYIKLSHNTKSLYPNIQFFAVSCDHHEDVCEEYGIRDFPTLRLFREDDGPSSKGKTAEFDEDDARSMRATKKIADFLGLNSVAGGKEHGGNSGKSEKPLPLDERKLGSSANDDDDDDDNKEKNDDDDDDGVKKSNDEDKKNNNDKSNDNDDDGVKKSNDGTSNDKGDSNADGNDEVKKPEDTNENEAGGKTSKSENNKGASDGRGGDNVNGEDAVKKSESTNQKNNEEGASNDKSGDNADGEDTVKKSESTDKPNNEEGASNDKGGDNADGEDIVKKIESTDPKKNEEGASNDKGGEDTVNNSESTDNTNNEEDAINDKGGDNADGEDIVKKSESTDEDDNDKGDGSADRDDNIKISESNDKNDDDNSASNKNDDDDSVKKTESRDKDDDDDDDGISNDRGNGNGDNVKKSESKGKNDDDDGGVKKSESEDKNGDDDDDNTSNDNGDDDTNSNNNEDDDDAGIPNNYSEIHKRARQNYLKKRQGYLRKDDRKNKQGSTIEKASFGDMTKGMKQYTPGTKEFQDRNKSINIRVRKGRRKNKFHGRTKTFTKASFPLRKDVTKAKWMKSMSNEEELILDVTLSLITGLSAGMMMGIEDVTSKAAMKDWLDLLSVSLPPEWNIHKLIDSLRMNFEDATKSKARFQEIVKSYPIARKGWSRSCQNRKLGSEGFSCGFWKLLHVITLGVAEQRGGRNLIDSGMMSPTTVVFSPSTAADTIRNYMDKFFTCRPCREHFLQTYDDCKNNRRCKRLTTNKKSEIPAEWKEISLWLWEFHNDVSVRLIGERISKTFTRGVKNTPTASDEVVGIWPNVNSCILCFQESGKWNDAEVFRFLERNYWPDSETDPLTDKLLKFESEGTSESWMPWFGAFLFVWIMYKLMAIQSHTIRQPLVSARLLYCRGIEKKMRVV